MSYKTRLPRFAGRSISTFLVLTFAISLYPSGFALADTFIRGLSSSPGVKRFDADSESWDNIVPSEDSEMTWVSGANNVDGVMIPETTPLVQQKFRYTAGGHALAKALTPMHVINNGSNGSTVITSGTGRSTVTIGRTTTYTCEWMNSVSGRLGNKKPVNWRGKSQGLDPFYINPDDFSSRGITGHFDLGVSAGLAQDCAIGPDGLMELNLFYDIINSTTNLLSIQITPNDVIITSDMPPGLDFYLITDSFEQVGSDLVGNETTLEELRELLENDILSDGVLDQPLYIGIVWEDIPVPTVDLGNGAVARYRVETLVEDSAVADELIVQQDVDGYTGLRDLIIGNDLNNGDGNIDGAAVPAEWLDGLYDSPEDRQYLLQFQNIENMLPPGATILQAELQMQTPPDPFAESLGPFACSQLLLPFDPATSFNNTFGGFRFFNGLSDNPLANGFIDPQPLVPAAADVTQMVQNWVNGEPNFGMAVTPGTADEWLIFTSGVGNLGPQDPLLGPALHVMFTDPQPLLPQVQIPQIPGDPTSQMFIADPFANQLVNADLANPDGVQLGGPGDLQALLMFDNLFFSQGGQIPDNAQIVSAQLLMTTSSSNFNQNAGTLDEFGVRPILNLWNAGTPFGDLIMGPWETCTGGLIADAQPMMDITGIFQQWQMGMPNHGINIAPKLPNSDDWYVMPSATFLRGAEPMLMVQWLPAQPVVLPDSYSVTRGEWNSGGVARVQASDNDDLSIRRKSSDVTSRTEFVVTGFSPAENPVSMQLTLEGSVFARSTVNQTIELFNFDTGLWEVIDVRAANRFGDSTVTVSPGGDLSRFVEDGTLDMKARIRFVSPSNRQRFTSNTDQFFWTIE